SASVAAVPDGLAAPPCARVDVVAEKRMAFTKISTASLCCSQLPPNRPPVGRLIACRDTTLGLTRWTSWPLGGREEGGQSDPPAHAERCEGDHRRCRGWRCCPRRRSADSGDTSRRRQPRARTLDRVSPGRG